MHDWLLDTKRFTTLIKLLLDDKNWGTRDLEVLASDPILTNFQATQWCRSRQSAIDHPLTTLTLFLSYQWSLLFSQLIPSRPRYRLQVLLYFARFIWPAYRIWVLAEPPARPTHREAAEWLSTGKQLELALAELGQPTMDETFAGFAKIRLQTIDSATVSRWITEGGRHFHRHLCSVVGLNSSTSRSMPTKALAPSELSWVEINQYWEQRLRTRQPLSPRPVGFQPLVQVSRADLRPGVNSLFYVFSALAEDNIIALVNDQGSGKTSLLFSVWRALTAESNSPIFFLDPSIAQQASNMGALAAYWLDRKPAGHEVDFSMLVNEELVASSHLLIDNFDAFPQAARAAWMSNFERVRRVILTCSTYDPHLDLVGGHALYLNRKPSPQ